MADDFAFDDEDDKGKRDDRRKPDRRAAEGDKPARPAPRAADEEDDDRGRRPARRRDEDDDRDLDDDYDRPAPRRRGPAGPSPADYFTFARTLPPMAVMIIFWVGVAAFVAVGIDLISSKATMFGIGIAVVGSCFWRLLCDRVVLATKTVEKLDEIAKALAAQTPAKKE